MGVSKTIQQIERQHAEEEKESGEAKPTSTLFAGAGHSLSSGSTAAAGGAGSAGAAVGGAGSGSGADKALLALVASARVPVDESKPTTTIQVRLASGARIKARLNLDQTVADLWRLIADEMGADSFKAASQHELSAGFPPKPLTDPKVTLKAADLANAAVTHRCK